MVVGMDSELASLETKVLLESHRCEAPSLALLRLETYKKQCKSQAVEPDVENLTLQPLDSGSHQAV